jgi:hypothetical protein
MTPKKNNNIKKVGKTRKRLGGKTFSESKPVEIKYQNTILILH